MTQVAVLILAAGAGRRFCSNGALQPTMLKQLATIGDETLIEKVCNVGLAVAPHNTYAVLGYQAHKIGEYLPEGVKPVINRDWQQGMGSSIATGVRRVSEDCKAVLILLADQVLVSKTALQRLLAEYSACAEDKKIVCSQYSGIEGVPAIFPRSLFTELMGLQGDLGAKCIIRRHPDQCIAISMPEAAIDVDTPFLLQQLDE